MEYLITTENINFFVRNGAKKYAYIKEVKKEKIKDKSKVNIIKENENTYDVLEITVSGVPKNGAFDLKNLEEFTDELEFTFKNTNKNTLFYCEDQKEINLTDYLGNTIKVSDKSRLLFSTYNL